MPLRRVVILHGYTAHPGKHWFRWLREQLAPFGVTTEVPPKLLASWLAQWADHYKLGRKLRVGAAALGAAAVGGIGSRALQRSRA